MTTLNELELAALTDLGFTAGTINEREMQWLEDATSETGLSLNGQWMFYLNSLSYETGTLNGRQMEAWGDMGYTGTWNSRAIQFWDDAGGFTPPNAPTDLSLLVNSSSSITVQWAGNPSDDAKFRVERSLDDSAWSTVATTLVNEFVDTGLTANTTYYYRVFQYGPGDSDPSSSDSATTDS